jgi:hypothetical protein
MLLDPQEIPAQYQFEAWRQATTPLYESLPVGDAPSVRTRISSYVVARVSPATSSR